MVEQYVKQNLWNKKSDSGFSEIKLFEILKLAKNLILARTGSKQAERPQYVRDGPKRPYPQRIGLKRPQMASAATKQPQTARSAADRFKTRRRGPFNREPVNLY